MTIKERDLVTGALNRALAKRGSTASVCPQRRNGHTGLDLYVDGRCLKTLTVGTVSEVVGYMRGMQEALWLLEEPFRA